MQHIEQVGIQGKAWMVGSRKRGAKPENSNNACSRKSGASQADKGTGKGDQTAEGAE